MVNAESLAHEALAHHSHFRHHADEFEFEQCGDVLLVRGRVPSFYLKQVLQMILLRVDGIRLVDNRVDVVSSEGPSSVGNN